MKKLRPDKEKKIHNALPFSHQGCFADTLVKLNN